MWWTICRGSSSLEIFRECVCIESQKDLSPMLMTKINHKFYASVLVHMLFLLPSLSSLLFSPRSPVYRVNYFSFETQSRHHLFLTCAWEQNESHSHPAYLFTLYIVLFLLETLSHLAQYKPYEDETKSLPPVSTATVSSSIGIHPNSSAESARRGEEGYVFSKWCIRVFRQQWRGVGRGLQD